MAYSPHFVPHPSPIGLGVWGGNHRYSPWAVKPCFCEKAGVSFHPHLLGAIQMPSLLSTTTKGPPYFFLHWRLNTYRTFMKQQLFTFLFIYLSIYLSIYLAASSLSCGTWDLRCILQIFCCRALTLHLWHLGSVAATCGLSYSKPGVGSLFPYKKSHPHLYIARQILNHWTARESLLYFSNILPVFNHSSLHTTKNRPC